MNPSPSDNRPEYWEALIKLEEEFGDEESVATAKRGLKAATRVNAVEEFQLQPVQIKNMYFSNEYPNGIPIATLQARSGMLAQQQTAAEYYAQMQNSTTADRIELYKQQMLNQQNNPYLSALLGQLGKPN